MKIIGKQILNDFKKQHADSRTQIESWEAEVEEDKWNSPVDLKQRYPKASILKDKYVVFNICGNKYRLLVQVAYNTSIVLIKKIGTHKEYDNWNIS